MLGTLYQDGTVDRGAVFKAVSHTVTSAEDTANSTAITITDLGNIDAVVSVLVESTGNVFRVPQGAVTTATNVVSVADTGLAVGEVVHLTVVAFNS